MAKIIVNRSSEYENKIRKIKLEINGEINTLIKDGEEKIIEVEPGYYTVKAKIDWCTSNVVELNLAENSEVRLYLSSSSGSALYKITFGRKNFLKLAQIEN